MREGHSTFMAMKWVALNLDPTNGVNVREQCGYRSGFHFHALKAAAFEAPVTPVERVQKCQDTILKVGLLCM